MLGIIIQLILSWIIVFAIERKHLGVLGLAPSKQRIKELGLFFLVSSICCALGFIIKIISNDQVWHLNPKLSFMLVLEGFWWNLKSVLFEELIFRGVLLYILIRRLGSAYAMVISAAAFGIYHWFSYGIIGNPEQMTYVFILTGMMGLLLAYAYNKTFSLYVPIAIHLGWNLVQNFIFSSGPIDDGIFISRNAFRTDSWLVFLSASILPMASILLINF